MGKGRGYSWRKYVSIVQQLIENAGTATWGLISGNLSDQTDLQNALDNKADLVAGKVPASQLPSYVDDVEPYNNFASLPISGETGKIYITTDSDKQYRWSGSSYVQITNGLIASTADVPDSTNKRYVTDAQLIVIGNTSGTNTGDETQATIISKLGTLKRGNIHLSIIGLFGRIIAGSGSITQPIDEVYARLYLRYNSGTGGTKQCEFLYDGVIPEDFSAFPANSLKIDTRRSGAVTTFAVQFYNNAGTQIFSTSISPSTTNVWEAKTVSVTGTWNAGDRFIIRIFYDSGTNGVTHDISEPSLTYTKVLT